MCYVIQDGKKLENICVFIWRYEIFFVPLHPLTESCGITHRGPATGFSYDRGEGQTKIGAGPKLSSARSPFLNTFNTLNAMINYSITARAVPTSRSRPPTRRPPRAAEARVAAETRAAARWATDPRGGSAGLTASLKTADPATRPAHRGEGEAPGLPTGHPPTAPTKGTSPHDRNALSLPRPLPYRLLRMENNKNNIYNDEQLFGKPCAELSLLKLCHGEKECHEME